MTNTRNAVGVSNSTNNWDVSYRSKPRSATLFTSTAQHSQLKNCFQTTPGKHGVITAFIHQYYLKHNLNFNKKQQ